MDDLSYSYNGNKLKAVEDGITDPGYSHNDFCDNTIHQTVEYEYDYNGNLVSDDNKGIQSISYNYLNLPEEIAFSSTHKINYLYAADGTKLRETITNGQTVHTYDYCSNMVYFDEELSYILTPAGRAVYDEQQHSWSNEYFLKDHLGNVRVVYGDPDRDHIAEVIQEDHYYPFGMTMGDLTYSSGLANRYLYQGKETTSDFNLWWQDFHARRFDSQLGGWHVPDPAGQYMSPYIGMGNNPVLYTDANGTWAVGGPWYWSRAFKEAEQVVADFRKQLMESYSSIDWEREIDQMELWNDIIAGKYKTEGSSGNQGTDESDKNQLNNENDQTNYQDSGDDMPHGGIMFYDDAGNPLYVSRLGEENIIYIIKEESVDKFMNSLSNLTPENSPLTLEDAQLLADVYSSESYDVWDYTKDNVIIGIPIRPWYSYLGLALSYAADGFARGYIKGEVYYKKGGTGLVNHYESLNGPDIIWGDYFMPKTFKPWWK